MDKFKNYYIGSSLIMIFMICVIVHYNVQVNKLQSQLLDTTINTDTKILNLEHDIDSNTEKINNLDKEVTDIKKDIDIINNRLDLHSIMINEHTTIINELLDDVVKVEEYIDNHSKNVLGLKINNKDVEKIASLVYLEAGNQSFTCQKAVASVVFNQMIKYHKSVNEVIYNSDHFTVAKRINSTKPSTRSILAVRYVLEHGRTVPRNVTAFRNKHYHNFGRPYKKIDQVYFSYN